MIFRPYSRRIAFRFDSCDRTPGFITPLHPLHPPVNSGSPVQTARMRERGVLPRLDLANQVTDTPHQPQIRRM